MNNYRKDIASLVGVLLVAVLILSVFISYKSMITVAGVTATNNVNAIIEIPNTCYTIVNANSLNFGTLSPGTTSGTLTTTVSDTQGNIDSFPWISGGSWLEPASGSTIYVTNTMYHNSVSASFIALTTTATNTYAMIKPTSTTISNVLTLEVTIPNQQTVGTYNQLITVTDTC